MLCKGAKYPPVLPRPTLLILPFQLPFCEAASDRGSLEVVFMQLSAVTLCRNQCVWSLLHIDPSEMSVTVLLSRIDLY